MKKLHLVLLFSLINMAGLFAFVGFTVQSVLVDKNIFQVVFNGVSIVFQIIVILFMGVPLFRIVLSTYPVIRTVPAFLQVAEIGAFSFAVMSVAFGGFFLLSFVVNPEFGLTAGVQLMMVCLVLMQVIGSVFIASIVGELRFRKGKYGNSLPDK